jgi:hypothetical protein
MPVVTAPDHNSNAQTKWCQNSAGIASSFVTSSKKKKRQQMAFVFVTFTVVETRKAKITDE